MAAKPGRLIFFAIALAVNPAWATVSFRGSAIVAEADANAFLLEEFAAKGPRIDHFESAFAEMYPSLPKNEHGNLGHQAVRYALHRYFESRHGWFIRGLEPGNATWSHPPNAPPGLIFVQEWVPNFIQNTLEKRLGESGVDIHGLAALAATMEDLIHQEVQVKLGIAYELENVSITDTVTRDSASNILQTYLLSFLLANNLTAENKNELRKKETLISLVYAGYTEVHHWYTGAVDEKLGNGKQDFSLGDLASVANKLGEEYHTFNEQECSKLRTTLQAMQSNRPGRVRLSTFYNSSVFTHWKFTEKPDYLRSLGALDASDPNSPHVIIPNYVTARLNCLDASNLYAVCCHSACTGLMTHLETEIGMATATPLRIAALISTLSPDAAVSAPRDLPASLLEKLEDIANHHGGEVPIHGRLFAQWMHHAYPMDCPYPHEEGKVNPQTADEWMAESGEADEQLSEEELRRIVEADTCAVNAQGRAECQHEVVDLPWTMTEELLTSHYAPVAPAPVSTGSPVLFGVVLLGLISASIAALLVKGGKIVVDPRAMHMLGDQFFSMLAVLLLCVGAYTLDLLNGWIVVCAVFGNFAAFATQVARESAGKHMILPNRHSA